MINSIFHNLAIRCTDWNQMLQLEEMAKKEGKVPVWFGKGFDTIENGRCIFMLTLPETHNHGYSNYHPSDIQDETELSFDQFIQSINQK